VGFYFSFFFFFFFLFQSFFDPSFSPLRACYSKRLRPFSFVPLRGYKTKHFLLDTTALFYITGPNGLKLHGVSIEKFRENGMEFWKKWFLVGLFFDKKLSLIVINCCYLFVIVNVIVVISCCYFLLL
jgi:hypothetical protein